MGCFQNFWRTTTSFLCGSSPWVSPLSFFSCFFFSFLILHVFIFMMTFTALFSNMRTSKFKAQPTNAFFATVNQIFGGISQLPTTAKCAVIKSLCTVQTTKQCSTAVASWEEPPNKPHPQNRILVPLRGEKQLKPHPHTHKTGSWYLLGVKNTSSHTHKTGSWYLLGVKNS